MKSEEIAEFYDQHGHKMNDSGVHSRHWAIYDWLKTIPRISHAKQILEIGAGPGQVTWLLSKAAKNAKILAVDISKGSIELARKNLKGLGERVDFLVSDMVGFESDLRFDFVMMPDVLEHIPEEQHPALFQILDSCMTPGALIGIHLPDRQYLDSVRKNRPELLQIVDQSISTSSLAASLKGTDLEIVECARYPIGMAPFEYRRILIEKDPGDVEFFRYRPTGLGWIKRVFRKVFCSRIP